MHAPEFFSIFTFAQSILLAVLLLLNGQEQKNRAALYLSGFFTLTAMDLATQYGHLMPVALPEWTQGFVLPLYPLFPVLLWFYVRALTHEDSAPMPRLAPHLFTIIGAFCFIALAVLLPEHATAQSGIRSVLVAELGLQMFLFYWAILLAIYLGAIILRLRWHRKRIKQIYSNLKGRELRWLDFLIGAVLVLVVLKIVEAINMALFGIDILSGGLEAVFEVSLVFTLGLFGVRQQPMFTESAAEDQSREVPAKRYANSAMTDADCARIAARLDKAMEHQQLWLDPDLRLRSLSTASGVSENKISQALSTAKGVNFFVYVNEYRIEEAKRLLSSAKLNVLEISEATGFNSKSTFNAAFKSITGQTPTQYRRRNGAGDETEGNVAL